MSEVGQYAGFVATLCYGIAFLIFAFLLVRRILK